MNVVDSSGWLEYIAQSPRARFFSGAIEDTKHLLVPAIVLYEVFKKVLRERGEEEALQVIAHMYLGVVIEIDADIALAGARMSVESKLPMADSLIYATSQRWNATLWTQDADLKGLEGVKYFEKKK